MNKDLLRVTCKECQKVMFNIEFVLHKCNIDNFTDVIYLEDENNNHQYIFYDWQLCKKWCFVDTRKGHFIIFENREKGINYLEVI